MKKTMESFVCLYPITKTLRFELIPIGDTLKNIEKTDLSLETNQGLKAIKNEKTLDEYHEHFIEVALKNVKLTKLKDYYELYCANAETKKTAKFKAEFNDIKKELRKEIVNCFKNETNKEIFDKLGKKELITKVLETWIKKEEKNCYFDPGFKKFTTYFRGYNINRSNMYSLDEKPSSIAYRLINENLPKFIDNIKVFEKLKKLNFLKILKNHIISYKNI